MRDRIAALVPNAIERTLLTTFHSFAAALLRQHGHHRGLKPDFTILAQETDRLSLLNEAIRKAKVGSIDQTSEKLLPLISWLTEQHISPDEAHDVLERQPFKDPETLASIYQHYRRLMIEGNTLDFTGLIAEALSLLKDHPGICKQIQRVYPYICVDEFQDTNLQQYKILHHFVNEKTKNLFVVADDDQIIYQWNGANPQRLPALQENFEIEILQLPENYRCPPAVVELANKLISKNFGRFANKEVLTAHKKASDAPVTIRGFAQFSDEAETRSPR